MLEYILDGAMKLLFSWSNKIRKNKRNPPQAADFFAFEQFVSDFLVTSQRGAFAGGFELQGMHTELAPSEQIQAAYESLARIVSSIPADVEITMQFLRRNKTVEHPSISENTPYHVAQLLKTHQSTFRTGFDNRFFVILRFKGNAEIRSVDSIRQIRLALGNVQSALAQFKPEPIPANIMRGLWRALANGVAICPTRRGSCLRESDSIADGPIDIHGDAVFSVAGFGSKRFAALADLKEVPYDHQQLAIDASASLKRTDGELDFTIKFSRLGKKKEVEYLEREAGRRKGADQEAVAVDFDEVKGAVLKDELAVGNIFCSLAVWSSSAEDAQNKRSEICGDWYAREGIKMVHGSENGIDTFFWRFTFACEKLSPPRQSVLGSAAVAKLLCFGSFYQGKSSGNKFGSASVVLPSPAGHPIYLALDQEEGDQSGPEDFPPQNLMVFGPVGSGKSTLFNFFVMSMAGQLGQLGGMFIDRNEGNKFTVLACGGQYFKVEMDRETGWNPLGLEYRPGQNTIAKRFVYNLVAMLCEAKIKEDRFDIEKAVDMAFRVAIEDRWLGTVAEYLQSASNRDALERWTIGPFKWLLNGRGKTPLDERMIGCDITSILGDDVLAAPALLYLMHRVERMNSTNAAVLYIAELAAIVRNEFLTDALCVGLATWRKSGLATMLDTQSPTQLDGSRLLAVAREQCRVKAVYPSGSMNHAAFDALGIPEEKTRLLQQMTESRQFGWFSPVGDCIVDFDLSRLGKRNLLLLTGSKRHVEVLEAVGNTGDELNSDELLEFALKEMGC